MDDVAVGADVPQPGREGDRLVGHQPHLLGPAVCLHREGHRRVDGLHVLPLKGGDDVSGRVVHFIAGAVEFDVGDRPGRTPYRPTVHSADEADEALNERIDPQDAVTLAVERGPADLHEPHVVGPTIEAEPPQPCSVQHPVLGSGPALPVRLVEMDHGRMVSHASLSSSGNEPHRHASFSNVVGFREKCRRTTPSKTACGRNRRRRVINRASFPTM